MAFAPRKRLGIEEEASGSRKQLSVPEALQIAKYNNGVPPAIPALVEDVFNDLWRRIQAQPADYVMTKEEFAVFNYYRSRLSNDSMIQNAISRFWASYKGDTSTTDDTKLSKHAALDSLPVPPPGFLGLGQRSTVWHGDLVG